MSHQAVTWALDEAPMLRTEKGDWDATSRAVLVARAERADEHGRDTHAAIEDVIWRTGFDERTIQRAEKRLEKAGLLVRVGITRHGTPRWNLDMSKRRDPAERAEIEAAIEKRKGDNAARERARRERLKASRVESASTRVDGNSTRVESASTRVDFDSTRVDAAPPEPPTNRPGTPREPSEEPPSGGTLPPDPLRPQDPKPGDLGNGIESSLSSDGGQPPRSGTASYDRARESNPDTAPTPTSEDQKSAPSLTLIPGGLLADNDETPRPARRVRPGLGICVPCGEEGHFTVAADPDAGSLCASHIAKRRTS